MRALPLLTCLWPGLARLWLRGDWTSVAVAVVFGAALNLLLVSCFVWPEVFPTSLVRVGWFGLAVAWCIATVRSYRSFPDVRRTAHADERDLFIEAQGEYLKGRWRETESLLQRLICRSPRDVDARLMLATLYRRTRRMEEAFQQLRAMERLDEAERWRWELAREQEMLDRARSSATGENGHGSLA